jgi:hypothetical protein
VATSEVDPIEIAAERQLVGDLLPSPALAPVMRTAFADDFAAICHSSRFALRHRFRLHLSAPRPDPLGRRADLYSTVHRYVEVPPRPRTARTV